MSAGWAGAPGKRLFDLAVAVLLLLPVTAVVLVLALVVRLGSPGAPIFSQGRVGRGERLFLCRKLRSMRSGTPSVATHDAPRDAVTPVGRVLRKFKLDELPQIWNVVKGEMSLVGPRPCLASQAELVRHRRDRGVFRLRPGITGLAQLRGIDMSTPGPCAEADAEYTATATLALDLRLLAATVLPGLVKPPRRPEQNLFR